MNKTASNNILFWQCHREIIMYIQHFRPAKPKRFIYKVRKTIPLHYTTLLKLLSNYAVKYIITLVVMTVQSWLPSDYKFNYLHCFPNEPHTTLTEFI